MNMLPRSAADRGLIEAIYDAGVSVDCWQSVVDDLAARFPGSKVVLMSEDVRGKTGIPIVSCGLSKSIVDKYSRRLSSMNPWVPVIARLPAFEPHVADDVLPSSSFSDTEFYSEYISSERDMESATWMKIFEDEDRFSALYIHYGEESADSYNKSVPILLKELSVHLRTAVELNQRICRRPSESLRSLIDASGAATFVIDVKGAVWLANGAAVQLLDDPRLASLDASERLVLGDPVADSRLQSLRSEWSRSAAVEAVEVSVSRPDGAVGVWTIAPFCGARNAHMAWLNGSAPVMLVSHERRERGAGLNMAKFSRTYNLTPAEARLAAHIASGRALREATLEYNIAIGTARNQLKSVFQKVGVHRQNELAALIAEKFSDI